MAEPQYRFGGPTPEAVKALRARRLGRNKAGRIRVTFSLEPTRLQLAQVLAISKKTRGAFPEVGAEAIMPGLRAHL
ncbi:hypothetical protein [Delftia tsuruhatensis]|uniref:hypothetical protein n=1 Tax=Delftia tsuruhatensis TaxID=180282 RepID=UPI0020911867|nr:hypothetical protein [Delftia tsuruhatensis]MCO5338587.1 hypothetical protein [Delftia tsuruhatensis]MCR4546629.1 hypothetical protein [Delftia tsuruhatensis]